MLHVYFAPEINLSFSGSSSESLALKIEKNKKPKIVSGGAARESHVTGFTANDEKNGVTIETTWNNECDLAVSSVDAEWLDREGSHREYQCTSFLPAWRIDLPPEGAWESSLQLSFSGLP